MYTEKDLKIAAGIVKWIAQKEHMPEAQVRAKMREAMDAGRKSADPAVQARWAEFHFAGPEPTVEEFILWAASLVKKVDADTEKVP